MRRTRTSRRDEALADMEVALLLEDASPAAMDAMMRAEEATATTKRLAA